LFIFQQPTVNDLVTLVFCLPAGQHTNTSSKTVTMLQRITSNFIPLDLWSHNSPTSTLSITMFVVYFNACFICCFPQVVQKHTLG